VSLGRTLIALGLGIAAIGALFLLSEKLGFRLGRLPGDIVIRGKNSTFYFPLATCVLLSVFLSFVMWLFRRR